MSPHWRRRDVFLALNKKCKVNSHQVTRCKATCFWSPPNYPSAKHFSPLQSYSLVGLLVDDCLYRIRPVVLSSGFYSLSRKFKSLNQSSFCEFSVEPFGLRCGWILSWKYVRVAGLYATPFFLFTKVLPRRKDRILLLSTRSSFDQNLDKVYLSYFVVCYVFFPFLVSNKDSELVRVFFVYFVGWITGWILSINLHHSSSNRHLQPTLI